MWHLQPKLGNTLNMAMSEAPFMGTPYFEIILMLTTSQPLVKSVIQPRPLVQFDTKMWILFACRSFSTPCYWLPLQIPRHISFSLQNSKQDILVFLLYIVKFLSVQFTVIKNGIFVQLIYNKEKHTQHRFFGVHIIAVEIDLQ